VCVAAFIRDDFHARRIVVGNVIEPLYDKVHPVVEQKYGGWKAGSSIGIGRLRVRGRTNSGKSGAMEAKKRTKKIHLKSGSRRSGSRMNIGGSFIVVESDPVGIGEDWLFRRDAPRPGATGRRRSRRVSGVDDG